MKAVAIAFVLIAGAAVVLWYGNTLNSWVLGGLIGGLAALLLSIPISLLLFSHLSKRHDERLRAEEQEEMALAREYELPVVPERFAKRPREVEGFVINEETSEDDWYDQEMEFRRRPRALPAPSSQRQGTPRIGQANRNSDRMPTVQQGSNIQPAKRTQQLPPTGKETAVLRPTTRKINATGHEYTSELSQHRTEALRTARLEAAKQKQDDDIEVIPTNIPRKEIISRPGYALEKQNKALQRPSRPSRQPLSQTPPSRPVRNIVDAQPSQQNEHRTTSTPPSESDRPQRPVRRGSSSGEGAQQYPRTVPVRRSLRFDRSEQADGEEEMSFEENTTTTNSFKTLQRRAPYMYEDDPMRQEFEQQLEAPPVRRSSRRLNEEELE